MKYVVAVLLLLLASGCAAKLRTDPELLRIESGKLPPPDLTLTIPGLGPCTDGSDRTIRLNSNEPVAVLVHGCLGSAGQLRSLAQVFAYSGQQAVCFSYNDRDSMMLSSAQLISSLETLAGHLKQKEMTVIGHSQGGLVARKALVAQRPAPLKTDDLGLRLITISAPYAGIRAASHCASWSARILTLGLTVPLCVMISGDKWYEITHASEFIRQPGLLLPQVAEHLKIDTDESGTCRVENPPGRCAKDDYVFSLPEQRHPVVDGERKVIGTEVGAGHVEIVGDHTVVPVKLIGILQRHGVLREPEPQQAADFQRFLVRLYGGNRHRDTENTERN